MPVTIEGQQHSNTIVGRVMLADTTVGIPDLLAVLYDLDPDTRPEESIVSGAAIEGGFDLNSLGDRAGAREHLQIALRLQPTGPVADVTRRYLERIPP